MSSNVVYWIVVAGSRGEQLELEDGVRVALLDRGAAASTRTPGPGAGSLVRDDAEEREAAAAERRVVRADAEVDVLAVRRDVHVVRHVVEPAGGGALTGRERVGGERTARAAVAAGHRQRPVASRLSATTPPSVNRGGGIGSELLRPKLPPATSRPPSGVTARS